MSILIFATVVSAGVAVGVPAYKRLFRLLGERHDQVYEAMGRPTIWNRSIRKSYRVQKFLILGEYRGLGDPDLSKVSNFLRFFNPLLVIAVIISSIALISALT